MSSDKSGADRAVLPLAASARPAASRSRQAGLGYCRRDYARSTWHTRGDGLQKNCGTPVVTGLYTLLLLVIAFALLGGSRHLVVAADSATAAILASMLVVVAGGALGFVRWRRLGSGTRS